jgi:ferredoxin
MRNQPVYSVFFSPTGTTRAVVQAVAEGTGLVPELDINLTRPAGGKTCFAVQDLVLVGMPVYAGRLPQPAVQRFKQIRGTDTPVVAVVVYGNRAYDDALLELTDLCAEQGFRVVGAAAFVGEHSFSSDALPIAPGRPDAADLEKARAFGRQLMQGADPKRAVSVPGNRPYKAAMTPAGTAVSANHDLCTGCGTCAEICPTGAIRLTDGAPETEAESCIWCCACLKNCPVGARQVALPKVQEVAQRLHKNCQTRLEPEWFLN